VSGEIEGAESGPAAAGNPAALALGLAGASRAEADAFLRDQRKLIALRADELSHEIGLRPALSSLISPKPTRANSNGSLGMRTQPRKCTMMIEIDMAAAVWRRRVLALTGWAAVLLSGPMAYAAPATQTILESRLQPVRIGLFIANADGGGEHPLMPATGLDYDPAWSPDGQWIIFTSERDGPAQLYRVRPDGTGLEALTRNGAYTDQAAFAPDSSRIAFVTTKAAGFANLWTLDLRTRKSRAVTTGAGGNFRPSWSPDGQWLAFSSDRGSSLPPAAGRWEHLQIADIYIIRPDGSGLKRVTAHGDFCGSPKWLPDGTHLLAYCMAAQETLNARTTELGETKLVSIDVASGVATQIAAGAGEKFAPTPLASGRVAWLRKDAGAAGIYYDQGRPGPKGAIRSASWSPDGARVVFHKAVATPPNNWRPLWGPDSGFKLVMSSMMASFNAAGDHFVATDPLRGGPGGTLVLGQSGTNETRTILAPDDAAALAAQWAPSTDTIFFGLGQFRLFRDKFHQTVKSVQDRVDGGAHVAMIKPDGSGFQQLTSGDGNDGNPSPAPDGKRIVYRTFGASGSGLRILNLETKAITTLTTDYDNFPFWSPRRDEIMFVRQIDGDYEIFTIRPDGTGLKRLTFAKGNDAHMAWSPDGEWIAFASTRKGFKDEAIYTDAPQPYGELFVMRRDGSDVRQLTDNQWEDGAPTWQPNRDATQ
jgi:TolB protein